MKQLNVLFNPHVLQAIGDNDLCDLDYTWKYAVKNDSVIMFKFLSRESFHPSDELYESNKLVQYYANKYFGI